MKKTFALMVAVFALSVAFTSCSKEGQYMPKKKISEIVRTGSYKTIAGTEISRTEREVWTWNGKQLSYIDYYDANDVRSNTTMFRYDKNNCLEEINYGLSTAKFNYDDGLIDEIKVYNNRGELAVEYDFEHKGKTLTSIDIKSYDQKSVKSLPFNPLNFIIPENAASKVAECAATKGSSRIELTWTGKNITKMDYRGNPSIITYRWTYDDKVNPFKGLYDIEAYLLGTICSDNNVTKEELTNGTVTEIVDYSYTYDGKYPVRVVWESQITDLTGYITVPYHHDCQYKYQ